MSSTPSAGLTSPASNEPAFIGPTIALEGTTGAL
jgi:hypothetical protein